ncbi:MAG TPA: anti-sigma factor, partial [Acidimicrobiales bacterium]
LVAAAAAAVVALVAGIATAVGRGGAEDVVASARLQPLADATSVTAELVDDDGQLQLDIPLSQADLPAPNDGFYEVWLIDEAVDGMVSLGPARDDGVYDVPDDLDYRSFPIVDVSVERPDGDPEHSGTSVLRGTLS